jgi:hypothetical protein
MATLTSANAVLMIGVASLYNVPVQIQGFSVDDAFASEDLEMAETLMGIDGKLSGGWIPYVVPLEITLQADSTSNLIFDAIIQAEAIARDKYIINAGITIPSIGFVYAFTNGFLKKSSVMPQAKKILQPRKFQLDFQNISRSPI